MECPNCGEEVEHLVILLDEEMCEDCADELFWCGDDEIETAQ